MEKIVYDEDKQQTPNFLLTKDNYKFTEKPDISTIHHANTLRKNQSTIYSLQKRDIPLLRKIIKKNKISNLVNNYCKKVKRNNIYSTPVQYTLDIDSDKSCFQQILGSRQGIEMTSLQTTILTISSLLLIYTLSIFYTLALVFPEVQQNQILRKVQIFGLIFYLIQMGYNFCSKKYAEGRANIYIKQISINYLKTKFTIDFLSIIIIFLDLTLRFKFQLKFIRLIILFKISQSLENLQNIENIYITTTHRQQYWGLITVFIVNFTFAHILAVALNAMVYLDSNNWLVKYNLINTFWWQKYIWGYYWGTTTMLTVGYGDFVATNHKEAVCLIFIEMISCITLSYNINYVGNLINNIRQQSIQKNKSLKIFHQMSTQNKIDYQLQTRINNYIEQSYKIKKQFNFAQEDHLLNFLPQSLKNEYLNQVNLKIFKQIQFLKHLTLKTQSLIAQKINRLITHPDQIIQKKNQQFKFIMINKGELGFNIKNLKNNVIIEKLSVEQTPKLLSLQFLWSRRLKYQIKSLSYCILFYLQKQDLIDILKNSNFDYQNYCAIRDKSQHLQHQIYLYKCQLCQNEYHTKFNCPKIHYVPIEQHVINKYLHKTKISKQERIVNLRKIKNKYHNLKYMNETQNDLQRIRLQNNSQHVLINRSQSKRLFIDSIDSICSHNNNDFLKQLKIQANIHSSLPTGMNLNRKISNDTSNTMINNTNQMLQILTTLNNNMNINNNNQNNYKQQNFWNLEIDLMHDWKYYFPNFNTKQIKFRTSKKNRNKNL